MSNADRTLAQSPVSSFDQGEVVWCNRTLRGERPDARCQRPVDSSKVPEEKIYDWTRPVSTDRTLGVQRPIEYSKVPVRDIYDRTCPVSGDRTLPASDQHLNTGVWVELTGASGQHDQSVRSPRRGT